MYDFRIFQREDHFIIYRSQHWTIYNLLIMILAHRLEKLFVQVLSQVLSRLDLVHFGILRIWISKYLPCFFLCPPHKEKIVFFTFFFQFLYPSFLNLFLWMSVCYYFVLVKFQENYYLIKNVPQRKFQNEIFSP